jgi:hypothetical protein
VGVLQEAFLGLVAAGPDFTADNIFVALQLQTQWTERGHRFARWSADSREVIRLYKVRLQQQLTLSPRCGHLRGHGGVKGAVRYARVLSKQFAFVARFDIRSYYQSIDHRVMLAILSASGVSRDVFNVVQDYLCKPDVQRTGKGMVAGGSISPLLGAVYLAPLDRAMAGLCQQGSIRYQRFMDDYVIFAKTRHKLKAAIKRMVAVLGALQLEVHPDKRYIGKTEKGFYFLGYRFGPQKLLEPAAQSLSRLIERARRLQERGADSHRLRQYVQRWVTWLHGGLQGLVEQNRFNQIWEYVQLLLS